MNNMKKKVNNLVVDTSAFIKNAPLQEIGVNMVTVPAVVQEVTSKRQLRRLVVLPYELAVKDVFPEHVQFVSDFAKKTGDYSCLSATDLQVIALTYQLEKELFGCDHLHSEPIARLEVTTEKPPEDKNVVGFFQPKDEEESDYETASENEDLSDYQDTHVELVLKDMNETSEEEEGEASEEDEDSWITPDNIEEVKKHVKDEVDDEDVGVACLTTDFAMQNVLKQIGLKIVTLDGKIIKELRTYILRCYACFKTTSIMTKLFCPNCGHKTLKRVAVTVDADGKEKIHINMNRPLTARGKKFSLPHFQGGKYAQNPILSEDQPLPQQRVSRLSRQVNNPLDPDYIAGYSPFMMRDVTSKSAMLGLRSGGDVKHWMKKNPNEAKPNRRKKKK